MEHIQFEVNGELYSIDVEKSWTLLHVLREKLELTGTKCGCSTGDCGACMVVLNGEATRSCMVNARKLSGCKVLTIEGLANGEELHPIQQAFVDLGAVQCGFCTPGMIMSEKAFLDKNPEPSEQEVRSAIDKNLCRCTGYDKIVKAILEAARWMKGEF